jgi:integrase
MSTDTQSPSRISGLQPAIDPVGEELRCYDEHLRDMHGLLPGTRRAYLRIAGRLLRQRFGNGSIDIADLHPSDIRRFLAEELAARKTPSNASVLATGLRSYLRYRSTCGDSVGALTSVIASPAHWTLATLPRTLTADEVERLLGSCKEGGRSPKRSYAIVRCALDLGLRAGEIAHLTVGDIDWQAGTLTLRGTKSVRQDVLPLPVPTGEALAAYLQKERPSSASSAVFVRHGAPQDLPLTSSAVQKVINRAFRRSGLPYIAIRPDIHTCPFGCAMETEGETNGVSVNITANGYTGSHRLRHTFACRLVAHGSSLKEVADLLRHRSLTTTQIYAKLDTPSLSTVALPWPGSTS